MDASTPDLDVPKVPPLALVARDLLLVVATVLGFRWSRALDASSSSIAPLVDVVVGALFAVTGFLLHEWGHLTGALATGSRVQFPSSWRTIFLFKFDDGNDRRQFLAMAVGGFIASGIGVAGMLAVFTFHSLLDWVAIGLSVLGVIATIVLEVPPTLRVLRGSNVPRDYVKIS